MKRYKFSLEQVLKVRKIREKEKQKELAEAFQQLNLEMEKLEKLKAEEMEANALIQLLKEQHQSSVLLNTVYRNIEGKLILKQLQVENIQKAQKVVNEKVIQAISAQKDKKILEKLDEKQYENYLKLAEAEEQKFLDEVAVIDSIRKRTRV